MLLFTLTCSRVPHGHLQVCVPSITWSITDNSALTPICALQSSLLRCRDAHEPDNVATCAWDASAITGDDPKFSGLGGNDTGHDFHAAPDLDHTNWMVQAGLTDFTRCAPIGPTVHLRVKKLCVWAALWEQYYRARFGRFDLAGVHSIMLY